MEEIVNAQEHTRLIIGLREKGWSDTEIIDFCIWVESEDERYRTKSANHDSHDS